MEFLKSQLARLQQQFGQLTASQKMLSVSLVAIMVMTLTWWGRYAGTAEMEPLLDQDVSAEEFSHISSNLKLHNIPFTPSGSRILVPADRRLEAVAALGFDQALPKDFSSAFMDIVGKMDNPLNSHDRSEAIRNEARQATLAGIFRYFPKVNTAAVMIDTTQKRSFDNPVTARASVYLKMKSGEKADNRLVNAAADMICGAVAGIQRSNVKVIVDGVSRLFVSEDGNDNPYGGGNYLETIRDAESYYAGKVQQQLSFCDGVMVHVVVTPKDESSLTETDQVDPKVISREFSNENESTTTSSGNRPGGDVGVAPNTGSNEKMTIGPGAGGGGEGDTSRTEKTTIKTENFPSRTKKTIKSPAGSVTVTSASVTFPRSFFIKAYKNLNGSDKEPGEAVLGPFIASELERSRKVVKACLHLATEEALVVETYFDLLPAVIEAPAQTTGVAMLFSGHAKEIVLGVFALASLFMISMLVRKTAPAAVVMAGQGSSSSMPSVGSTVDAMLAKAGLKAMVSEDAAEVSAGGQALDGVELDDNTIRAQQVVEQVTNLAKENPDVAASMIKRWMNRA